MTCWLFVHFIRIELGTPVNCVDFNMEVTGDFPMGSQYLEPGLILLPPYFPAFQIHSSTSGWCRSQRWEIYPLLNLFLWRLLLDLLEILLELKLPINVVSRGHDYQVFPSLGYYYISICVLALMEVTLSMFLSKYCAGWLILKILKTLSTWVFLQ